MRIIPPIFAGFFLVACTTGGGVQETAIPAHNNAPPSHQQPADRSVLLTAFVQQCLGQINSSSEFAALAVQNGWQAADSAILEEAGLSRLKKTVLEIPGGGSPVRETQSLFSKRYRNAVFILGIEERYERRRRLNTSCSLYGQGEPLLKVCAALGKIIGRAPDENRRYEGSNSHFITWRSTPGDRPTQIRCQQSPQSQILPYAGVVLSKLVDQSPVISRRTSSVSRPRAGGS